MNDKSVLKSTWAAAFTVASVWFGTHVGGGFASGNQVIQYYSNYGYTSVIFPILAMGLLAVVMYIMMKFAKLSGFTNYKDTYAALYPKPSLRFSTSLSCLPQWHRRSQVQAKSSQTLSAYLMSAQARSR